MKNKIILIVFIVTTSVQCTKKHPCDYDFPDDVNNSSITVIFKDKKTNQFLFLENPRTIYRIDSLKIKNNINENLSLINSVDIVFDSSLSIYHDYWKINFGPIFDYRTDSAAFNTPIYKDFIVQYNYNTRDTLTTCFKAKSTPCGSTFEFLKLYYKGKIIDSATDDIRLRFTHYKQ